MLKDVIYLVSGVVLFKVKLWLIGGIGVGKYCIILFCDIFFLN